MKKYNRPLPTEGEIYSHFKREFSDIKLEPNTFLYKIITIAENTESGELMCIYKALYSPFKTYARPLDMFMSKVDIDKYPNSKQNYRFEKLSCI